jgi:small GTP-binding protein
MKHIKCVVVGYGECGISEILRAYTSTPTDDRFPTIHENYSRGFLLEDQQIHLQLWTTPRVEEYKQFRPQTYPQTDVFVVCFSLIAPWSLDQVQDLWVPEIKEHCPGTPYILVGTKSSLRDAYAEHRDECEAKGGEPVPASKGEEMKRAIGARAYVECDAQSQYNLDEVFKTAVKIVLNAETPVQKNEKHSKEDGKCRVA